MSYAVTYPDELTMLLFNIVFPVLIVMFVIVAAIFWILVLPDPSKKLLRARFSKKTDVFIDFPDRGIAQIRLGKSHPQAFAEIRQKPWHLIMFFPRRGVGYESLTEKQKEVFKTEDEYKRYEERVTKGWSLSGVGKPIFPIYSDFSLVISPEVLKSLEFKDTKLSEEEIQIIKTFAEKATEPQGIRNKIAAEVKVMFATLLDPAKVRAILPQNFSMDQVERLVQLCIEKGKLLAQAQSRNMMIIIAVLVFALGLMVGLFAGPKIAG